ncbi:transferrin-binding protein-like solute binding protein [Conchiformibius steedae]|uniref:transferrin-binding protein-like solute binding protein n=1 Tax=Conchiformibius steedae TaxID=153493 RepID=UPI00163A2D94|nr:transferrin-binding protein-like solute binding protein [Conchiformibius steedae]
MVSNGSHASQAGQGANNGSHQGSNTNQGNTSAGVVTPSAEINGVFVRKLDDKNRPDTLTLAGVTDKGNTHLDALWVNGQKIPLFTEKTTPVAEGRGSHSYIVGTDLQFARYGVINRFQDVLTDGYSYFFAQGEISPSLPNIPRATYSGQAFLFGKEIKENNGRAKGTAKFEVNFADKSLTGTISAARRSIDLQAEIGTDSRFYGKSPAGVVANGAFFGKDAAEMAGVFYEQPANGKIGNFGGVFGTSRQK